MLYTGTPGNDSYAGTSENDTVNGNSGDDSLKGGFGDDLVTGDDGDDHLVGGWGSDSLSGGAGYDVLDGEFGNDVLTDTSGGSRQNGGTGFDTLTGGSGDDVLDGGDHGDHLDGGGGSDVLSDGAAGNTDQDSLLGHDGDDILLSYGGVDHIDGGAGLDALVLNRSGSTVGLWLDMALAASVSGVTLNDGTFIANIELSEVTGGSGNDTLNGAARADVFAGGAGDDRLSGLNGNDFLDGGDGEDWLSGGAGHDTLVGGNGFDTADYSGAGGAVQIDLTVTTVQNTNAGGMDRLSGIEHLVGSAYTDRLVGNAAGNRLDGGAGVDTLAGGAGDDSYIVDVAGDIVLEASGEGVDHVYSAVTFSLAGRYVEFLTLTGAAQINATGNGLNNYLTGNYGNNVLDGAVGHDLMAGGLGDDTYYVDAAGDNVVENHYAGNDIIYASVSYGLYGRAVESLILTGAGHIDAVGNSLANVLTGNSGRNLLDGGDGNDTLTGGLGNDTYVINSTGDVIVEAAGGGFDTVRASISFTLTAGSGLEAIELIGANRLNATGSSGNNALTGNSGNNQLDGAGGSDTMAGGAGNDSYWVNTTGDIVQERSGQGHDLVTSTVSYALTDNVEDLILFNGSLNGTGNARANVLTGTSGANVLDGRGGNDTMNGGSGSDTYYVNSVDDVVVETGTGIDTIMSTVSWTLGTGIPIENVTLIGTAHAKATGNGLANALTGNSGNNLLDGQGGNDTMAGGLGDDTFIVNSTGDVIMEGANEGFDTIRTSVAEYRLIIGGNVEGLVLTSSRSANGYGNELNNLMTGNSHQNYLGGGDGNDTLIGGGGQDTLYGGAGDDSISGGGDDGFISGGDGNDVLVGGASYDELRGQAGADTMIGGGGNYDDWYFVDDAGDLVVETGTSGDDRVFASVSYVLADNIEYLQLGSNGDVISGTGNALNNEINGSYAADILYGAGGNDTLDGDQGNDTYIIDSIGDVIEERFSNDTGDTVMASISCGLEAVIENLILTGTADINGNGNDSRNILTGNSGANHLTGGGGNDTLNGGLGNDTLYGGDGGDWYIFDLISGQDVIGTQPTFASGDRININAYTQGVTNTGMVTQVGVDTVITLGDGNSITVLATTAASVTACIVW